MYKKNWTDTFARKKANPGTKSAITSKLGILMYTTLKVANPSTKKSVLLERHRRGM
jgi:hypothetical protein